MIDERRIVIVVIIVIKHGVGRPAAINIKMLSYFHTVPCSVHILFIVYIRACVYITV